MHNSAISGQWISKLNSLSHDGLNPLSTVTAQQTTQIRQYTNRTRVAWIPWHTNVPGLVPCFIDRCSKDRNNDVGIDTLLVSEFRVLGQLPSTQYL
jgi:hypothetical protein